MATGFLSIRGQKQVRNVTEATGTALPSQVLAGVTFSSEKGAGLTGSMKNNGSVSKTLDTNTTSYTIANGYHDGTGSVQIVTETKTVTLSNKSQTITPTSGKVLSSVTVPAVSGTAESAHVLTGKTFSSASGVGLTGAMTNNGSVSQTLDTSITSYTIPQGYHDGTGTVSLVKESKTVTLTNKSQTITPTRGKVLSSVTIPAVTGTAEASHVLVGKTFSSANGVALNGAMPNHNTENILLMKLDANPYDNDFIYCKLFSDESVGYHDESVIYEIPKAVVPGDVTADYVMEGYTFSGVNGINIDGGMTDHTGNICIDLITESHQPELLILKWADTSMSGYYDDANRFDLPASSIPGTAVPENVLAGKTFSSTSGIAQTGTIHNYDSISSSATSLSLQGANIGIGIPKKGYYTTTSKLLVSKASLSEMIGNTNIYSLGTMTGVGSIPVKTALGLSDEVCAALTKDNFILVNTKTASGSLPSKAVSADTTLDVTITYNYPHVISYDGSSGMVTISAGSVSVGGTVSGSIRTICDVYVKIEG